MSKQILYCAAEYKDGTIKVREYTEDFVTQYMADDNVVEFLMPYYADNQKDAEQRAVNQFMTLRRFDNTIGHTK